MSKTIHRNITIPDNLTGMRADQALASLLPEFSRTLIQDWIKNQAIKRDDTPIKSRTKVMGGDILTIETTLKPPPTWEAEAIALDIIFEDDDLLVINKPAGLVVHPAPGNEKSTLLNALLHHAPSLIKLPRAGIIHRLDKETSGILVIAKTEQALKHLTKQLKDHTVTRLYQAVVCGIMIGGGTVDAPIGRHPIIRKRMAVVDSGKPSVTHYRVMEKYRAHTRIKVQLETGRTHQIRVHMAYKHYPVLGDPVYGKRLELPKGASEDLITVLRQFKRQALHAYELGLIHPVTQKHMQWQAPLPLDFKQLITVLQNDSKDYDPLY